MIISATIIAPSTWALVPMRSTHMARRSAGLADRKATCPRSACWANACNTTRHSRLPADPIHEVNDWVADWTWRRLHGFSSHNQWSFGLSCQDQNGNHNAALGTWTRTRIILVDTRRQSGSSQNPFIKALWIQQQYEWRKYAVRSVHQPLQDYFPMNLLRSNQGLCYPKRRMCEVPKSAEVGGQPDHERGPFQHQSLHDRGKAERRR